MKPLLIIVLAAALTGCFQTINITEIKQAEKYCADKLGVRSMTEWASGITQVSCISGSTINVSRIKLVGK